MICGAPNVHADMWTNLVAAKSTIPASLMTLSRSCWMRDRCEILVGASLAADRLAVVRITREYQINERDIPAGVTLQAGCELCWKSLVGRLRAGN